MKVKVLPFLWQFVRNYKFSFIGSLIVIISLDIIELIGENSVLKSFIDGITNNKLNFNDALLVISLYAFLGSFSTIFISIKRRLSFGYQFKLKESIRNYMFQYLLKQSNRFFTNNFVGTINSKMNDIANNIGDFLDKAIDIISNMNCFIICLIIFAKKNTCFSLFLLVWTLSYFYVYFKFSKRIEKQTETATDVESRCSGKIIDCFTNILNIKNFSSERREKYNVKKHTKTILKERYKICRIKSTLDLIDFIGKFSFSAVVCIISLKMYFNKTLTLGELTFNLSVSTSLFWWLKFALKMLSENIENYGKIKQAIDTLIVEQEIKDKQNAKNLNISNGKIVFNNIDFSYKK